jgi:hypothetical protein
MDSFENSCWETVDWYPSEERRGENVLVMRAVMNEPVLLNSLNMGVDIQMAFETGRVCKVR